jgi:competence protein ComFC
MRAPDGLVVPEGCDEFVALVSYSGNGRELVRALKYRNHRDATAWIALNLKPLVEAWRPAVFTWIPASSSAKRRNGFDHSALLARQLSKVAKCSARNLLKRVDNGEQIGRSAAQRQTHAAFAARGGVARRVVLVDDVVTTGASFRSAARILRRV